MHALILAGLGLAIGVSMLERPAHSLRDRKKSVCPANALLRPATAPDAEYSSQRNIPETEHRLLPDPLGKRL